MTDLFSMRRDEVQVGLLGDTEGDQIAVLDHIRRFHDANIRLVLHLGDFFLGVGSERVAKRRLLQTNRWLEDHNQVWLITPGNHENWDRIDAKKSGPLGLLYFAERIAFAQRGHRWVWNNVRFTSLGGAPSLNASDLTEGKSWWPQEQLTEHEVELVIREGGTDVLLCHDAPSPGAPKVEAAIAKNPFGWEEDALAYAAEGRRRLSRAFAALDPLLLVHGHHHISDRANLSLPGSRRTVETVALARADRKRSSAILDFSEGRDRLRVSLL